MSIEQPPAEPATEETISTKDRDFVLVPMSHVEMWVVRLAGACLVACLAWVGTTLYGALITIAQIEARLEMAPPDKILAAVNEVRADLKVKPSEVLRAVNEAKALALTEDRVAAIVRRDSPWGNVEEHWRGWRELANKENATQNEILNQIRKKLDEKTADRFTRHDMARWLADFRRKNPEIETPSIE